MCLVRAVSFGLQKEEEDGLSAQWAANRLSTAVSHCSNRVGWQAVASKASAMSRAFMRSLSMDGLRGGSICSA